MTRHANTPRRRYAFHNRLGVGGFGEVYRATLHTGAVQMDVAIKLLRPEYGQGEQAGLRLRDEARFLSALRHPSIVRVIDLVKLDGRLALVTEFVDGEDLRWVLHRSGPIPARVATEVLARVADALHAAETSSAPGKSHPMRLIHRDIKPGNILVGSHGAVTLLDFGIARTDALAREADTAAYAILGSGPYTAPEVLLREPATPAGDIWGLATTVYEALSGERLFPETELKLLARLFVRGDPRGRIVEKLTALDVPSGLRQLLLDMLELEPGKRLVSLEVLRRADDLTDTLTGLKMRRWALERHWEAPDSRPGGLEGQTLEEQPLDASMAAPMPPTSPYPDATLPPTDDLDRPAGLDALDTEETEDTDNFLIPVLEEDMEGALVADTEPPQPAPQFEDSPEEEEELKTVVAVRALPPLPAPPAPAPTPAPTQRPKRSRAGATMAVGALFIILLAFVAVAGVIGSGVVLSQLPAAEPAAEVAASRAAPSPDTTPPVPDAATSAKAAARPAAEPRRVQPIPDEVPADEPPDDEPPDDDDGALEAQDAVAAAEPTEPPGSDLPDEPSPAPAPAAAPATPTAPAPAPSAAPQPAPAAEAPAPTFSTRSPDMDTAKVTFQANVLAEVHVDGVLAGSTPITVRLTEGNHRFEAMVPGFPATKTGGDLEVTPGTHQQVNLNFQKK